MIRLDRREAGFAAAFEALLDRARETTSRVDPPSPRSSVR